tara:strand:- start:183 stop:1247 length:1065 start_codon:yes stop_codon:yes gene_type:complete
MSRNKTLKGGSEGGELIQSRTRYGTGGGTTRQFTRQRSAWQSNCTEPAAVNYNPDAVEDDGSCEFPEFKWIMGSEMDRDSHPNNASLCDVVEPLNYGMCWYGYANWLGFSPQATENEDSVFTYGPDWCCNIYAMYPTGCEEHVIRCYPNVFDIDDGNTQADCEASSCHGELYDDNWGHNMSYYHSFWFDNVADLEHIDGLGLNRNHVSHFDSAAAPAPSYPLMYNAIKGTTGNASGFNYFQWWWPYEPGVERETSIQVQHTMPQWSFFYGGSDMYIDVTPYGETEINDWDDIERWFESIRLTDAFGGQIFDIDLMDRESVFIDDMHTTVILKTVLKDISVQRIGIPAGNRDNVS